MSVRKDKRGISPVQYVETAGEIDDAVKIFACKIAPDKYKIFGADLVRITSQLYEYVCKAESFNNYNEVRARLKLEALLQAGAELDALNAAMSRVLITIKHHPEAALVKITTREPLSPYDAIRKVSKAAMTVGNLILAEKGLLDEAIERCRKVLDKYRRGRCIKGNPTG